MNEYKSTDQVKATMPVPQAAKYIGISERKLREEIAFKKIRVIRIGRRVLLRASDIEEYLDKLSVGGPQTAAETTEA